MKPVSNFKLGIGMPLNFPLVHADFFTSFIAMDKPTSITIDAKGASIAEMRNGLVMTAQQAGCSHLLMVDTDMVLRKDTLTKLLRYKDLAVVGALCFKKHPPFVPVMVIGKEPLLDYPKDELIEVDKTGTGCMLINMQIFDKLKPPYFVSICNEYGFVTFSEDYYFCDSVREVGEKVFVDTSAEIGHIMNGFVSDERLYNTWNERVTEKTKQ